MGYHTISSLGYYSFIGKQTVYREGTVPGIQGKIENLEVVY